MVAGLGKGTYALSCTRERISCDFFPFSMQGFRLEHDAQFHSFPTLKSTSVPSIITHFVKMQNSRIQPTVHPRQDQMVTGLAKQECPSNQHGPQDRGCFHLLSITMLLCTGNWMYRRQVTRVFITFKCIITTTSIDSVNEGQVSGWPPAGMMGTFSDQPYSQD